MFNQSVPKKSNGKIEQHGIASTDSSGGCNLSFYVSFNSTDYVVMLTQGYANIPDKNVGYKKTVKQNNSIRIGINGDQSSVELSYTIFGN